MALLLRVRGCTILMHLILGMDWIPLLVIKVDIHITEFDNLANLNHLFWSFIVEISGDYSWYLSIQILWCIWPQSLRAVDLFEVEARCDCLW